MLPPPIPHPCAAPPQNTPSFCCPPQAADPVVPLLATSTEEGRKVQRSGGAAFPAVFRRVADAALRDDG